MELIQSYRQKDPNLKVEILSDVDHEDVISGKVDVAYLPYRPPAEMNSRTRANGVLTGANA